MKQFIHVKAQQTAIARDAITSMCLAPIESILVIRHGKDDELCIQFTTKEAATKAMECILHTNDVDIILI